MIAVYDWFMTEKLRVPTEAAILLEQRMDLITRVNGYKVVAER